MVEVVEYFGVSRTTVSRALKDYDESALCDLTPCSCWKSSLTVRPYTRFDNNLSGVHHLDEAVFIFTGISTLLGEIKHYV